MTNYLSAKNGVEILHDSGITQILAGEDVPDEVGVEATIGSIYMCSTAGTIYKKTDSGNYDWVPDSEWSTTTSGVAAGDMESIRLRCESGQTADNTGSTVIQWDTLDFKDTDFTHSTSTNNSRIEFGTTAKYLVTGSINYHGTLANYRLTSEVNVKMNGTDWLLTKFMGGYVRATGGANELAIPFSLIVEATAGDYIEILTKRISDTSGDGTVDGGSNISITRLQGAKGDTGDTGPAGEDGAGSGLYNAYLKYSDVKSTGTDGGTSGADEVTVRTLNTEDADTASIGSLSSNQVTLPAGIFKCSISCGAQRSSEHRGHLYDVTGSAVLVLGVSTRCSTDATTTSWVNGVFELTETSAMEVRHYTKVSRADDGLGHASSDGYDEVYTVAEFWRLG